MTRENSTNQGNFDSNIPSLEELVSSYEIAVLSTLFEEDDSDKLGDLAKQWGYQKEFLQSVWKEIHGDTVGEMGSEGLEAKS